MIQKTWPADPNIYYRYDISGRVYDVKRTYNIFRTLKS
jgi:hypothetical protein